MLEKITYFAALETSCERVESISEALFFFSRNKPNFQLFVF